MGSSSSFSLYPKSSQMVGTNGTNRTEKKDSKIIRDISPFRRYGGNTKKFANQKKSKTNLLPKAKSIEIEGDLMSGSNKFSEKSHKPFTMSSYSRAIIKPKITSNNPFIQKRSKSLMKSRKNTDNKLGHNPLYSPYSETNKKAKNIHSKTPERSSGYMGLRLTKPTKSPGFNFSQMSKTPSVVNRKLNLNTGLSSSRTRVGLSFGGVATTKNKPRSSTPVPKSRIGLGKLTDKYKPGLNYLNRYNKSTASLMNRSCNMANLIRNVNRTNRAGKNNNFGNNVIKVSGKRKPKTTIITMNINQEGTNNVLNISTNNLVQGSNVINLSSSNNSTNKDDTSKSQGRNLQKVY